MGTRLYRLVTEYAAIGHHRTGTAEDEACRDWLGSELIRSGAIVRRHEYDFDRYDARWECSIDGEEVQALPLYYEAVGQVETDRPYTAELELEQVELDVTRFGRRFDVVRADARREGAKAIVCPTVMRGHDFLAVPNRRVAPGAGLPTLLVPGGLAPRLREAHVALRFEAATRPARSADIVASFGASTYDGAFVLATPLSGWFEAAGERGTGIAIAIEIARVLAGRAPTVVVFTTGHELDHLGIRRLLAADNIRPRAIFFIGANVAAGVHDTRTGLLRHSDRGWKRASVSARAGEFEAALAELPGAFIEVPSAWSRDPEAWGGEAREWCSFGAPMVAIAGGIFPFFHALGDTPERSTSPSLVGSAYRAVLRVAEVLADVA